MFQTTNQYVYITLVEVIYNLIQVIDSVDR